MSHPSDGDFWHPQPRHTPGTNWSDKNGDGIRRAHPGKFRVLGEDHKYFEDVYPIAEYDTLAEAIECAATHDCNDEWFFVYNDVGELLWAASGKKPRS